MKKSLLCIVLSLIMMAVAFPATAHQDISDGPMNFSSYTDTNGWNGEKVTTGTLPVAQSGIFSQISAQSANNGITNGVAYEGSAYGNSVKLIQKYNASSGAYSGVKYLPDSPLCNTIYFEASIYIAQADDGKVITRGIYFRDGSGSSNVDAKAVEFSDNGSIRVFNSATSSTWSPNRWYDVKITYNINTEQYDVTILQSGEEYVKKVSTHTSKNLGCISEIHFRTQTQSKNMCTTATDESGSETVTPWDDQIFFLDNFLVKTDYRYEPITYNTDSFDFEGFKSGDNLAEKVTGTLGAFNWGYQGKKDCLIDSVQDGEKGTGISLTTIYDETYATGKETDNTKCYARVYYDVSEKNRGNTFFFKTSFMLKDYKYREIHIQLVQSDGTQVSTLTITDNKFNFPDDSNVIGNPQLDVWYDYECTIDYTTGYAQARISGNGENYASSWKDEAYTDAKFYRGMMTYRTIDSYDEGEESTVWLDDMEIGYIDVTLGDTFKIDTYGSTTGNSHKFDADSDTLIKFTQAIAPSSLTTKNVSVNFGAIEIDAVTAVDDYTVKVDFKKEKGKHYHVAFTDAKNADETLTLSDYIEFDTVPDKYVTGTVSFTNESDTALRFLEPGKLRATAATVSGDGAEHPAAMWAAIYGSKGELLGVSYKNIIYGAQEAQAYVEIDVPSDSSAYILKAGIFSPALKPLCYGKITPQIVILRLDDLRFTYKDSKAEYTYEDFVELANWAEEEKVDLSIGLICNTLEDEEGIDKSGYYKAISDMDASEYVEIWCHGYTHAQTGDAESGYNAEFNAPLEEQISTLRNCADIVFEKTGVVLHSLGVPHNIINSDTAQALEQVSQYKTLLCSKEKLESDSFIHLNNAINMEVSTGVLDDIENIKSEFRKSSSDDYIVFSGHSGRWSDEDTATFKELALWLKAQNNIIFMTPTEYYNFIK